MRYLMLDSNGFPLLIVGIIAFFIAVLIIRWIFSIGRIIGLLEDQNDQSLKQIKLLKKMLINQGVSTEEVDELLVKRNSKNDNFFNH